MKWKDLEGKSIISVVVDQIPASDYPDFRQPIAQEDCWTYGIVLNFSDGSSIKIVGLQHDESGGIALQDDKPCA